MTVVGLLPALTTVFNNARTDWLQGRMDAGLRVHRSRVRPTVTSYFFPPYPLHFFVCHKMGYIYPQ